MFPERIETERLELTPLTAERVDVLDFYAVCSGNASEDMAEVTAYLPWDPHETPKETKEFLDRVTEQRRQGEGAQFLLEPEDDGRFAGIVGLTADWERRSAELGIWLRKPFWGRGYYGEAFAELVAVAFDRLDLELVEILVRDGNEKSRRATEAFVERLGGHHEGRLRNYWTGADGVADAHRFTISKAEYEAASAEREDAKRRGTDGGVEREETTP